MAISLEYEPIKAHFMNCRLNRHSRSVYGIYDWTIIMTKKNSWYSKAQIALASGNFEECASICFQWLFSFVDAFDNDAFTYDEEGWEFTMTFKEFSDIILNAYDNKDATEELKQAIVGKYDELNHTREMYNYGWLNINKIIRDRGWNIETIDFNALFEAEQRAREEARRKALEEAELEKKREYMHKHFVCEYDAPSTRFSRQRPIYPIFQYDSKNFSKRLMYRLRKIYRKMLRLNNKEELMQRLDGYVRSAHLRAIKKDFEKSSLINNAILCLINEISTDEDFIDWAGEDTELLTELSKILRNATLLKNKLDSAL